MDEANPTERRKPEAAPACNAASVAQPIEEDFRVTTLPPPVALRRVKPRKKPEPEATPLLHKGNKGGTRPGHVWIDRAPFDLFCEGIGTLVPVRARHFAEGHGDIVRGDRFLKKTWRTHEGQEFSSRHCRACGRAIEAAKC